MPIANAAARPAFTTVCAVLMAREKLGRGCCAGQRPAKSNGDGSHHLNLGFIGRLRSLPGLTRTALSSTSVGIGSLAVWGFCAN
jgi:hypothetical protein